MGNYIKNPAILAVFYARPEILNSLIDAGVFDKNLLQDTRILCKPFPIWRISQCWKVISSMTGWRDDIRADVEAFRQRNEEVMKIFEDRLGVDFTPVDYQLYHDDFYCDYPDESAEDQLVIESVQELLDAGVRQIDIDLYCAGAKFYYAEVERLLKKGGNPAAWLPDISPSGFQLDDCIGAECSFLSTEVAHFLYSKKSSEPLYRLFLCDLVGWAAHETMYDLIEAHRQFPHWEPEAKDEDETTNNNEN